MTVDTLMTSRSEESDIVSALGAGAHPNIESDFPAPPDFENAKDAADMSFIEPSARFDAAYSEAVEAARALSKALPSGPPG